MISLCGLISDEAAAQWAQCPVHAAALLRCSSAVIAAIILVLLPVIVPIEGRQPGEVIFMNMLTQTSRLLFTAIKTQAWNWSSYLSLDV